MIPLILCSDLSFCKRKPSAAFISMSVGLMAARWPSPFLLIEKDQKIKAAQPRAKSSLNGWLQFEAVGMVGVS